MIKPLVSILCASFNRGLKLEYAIHSVLNQTYSNWELIIVDDSSFEQETIDVLAKYEKYDPRI